jgi:uncharacterized protein (TIGR04255 family)
MERFPTSELLLSRRFVLGPMPDSSQRKEVAEEQDVGAIKKIWKFITESGVALNVQVDSLDISSTVHKTYKNPRGKERFRDIIEFVLHHFFDVTQIPKVNRIGLRYIDECPVKSKRNGTFRNYYNTTLPLERFPLKDAFEMAFTARSKRGRYFLTFREAISEKSGKPNLILDFDGYAENIKASDCLGVTDSLHDLISQEFEASIKEPVYRHMRKKEKSE